MNIDPRKREFSQTDVLKVLPGLSTAQLNAWIQRNYLSFCGIIHDIGTGRRRKYSALDAMHIAIMHGLSTLKVKPKKASLHSELAQPWLLNLAVVYNSVVAKVDEIDLDEAAYSAHEVKTRGNLNILTFHRLGDIEAVIKWQYERDEDGVATPIDKNEEGAAQFVMTIDVSGIFNDVMDAFKKLVENEIATKNDPLRKLGKIKLPGNSPLDDPMKKYDHDESGRLVFVGLTHDESKEYEEIINRYLLDDDHSQDNDRYFELHDKHKVARITRLNKE